MGRAIPRRDFLQGTLIGAASVLAGPLLAGVNDERTLQSAAQDRPGYYPPALTGLRGSHAGSFEAAHALRDGAAAPAARDSGERYDLVVVGGGISGLAAAQLYRERAGGTRRILILDNHDDFGGHAKRNEFTLGGRIQLMNGGTLEIDSPRPYSAVAQGLLRTLGIDVPALARQVEHKDFYKKLGLSEGVFFDAETFGADKLVAGLGSGAPLRPLLQGAPLSARARADLVRVEEGARDYLPGVAAHEKKLRLSKISYRDFLRDLARVDPAVLAYYQARTHGWWGVGIDAIAALDCWAFGYPGFKGMQLPHGSIARMGPTAAGYHDSGGSATLHFPDGNATIARALVRRLIPAALPGSGIADLVSARADYAQLDRADTPVRLRLNSTVVRARHVGEPAAAREVEITYLRDGSAATVRAGVCVLACYNMMIPYLCPELPAPQQAALHELVKTPLVYTSVALRNWEAFARLKVSSVYAPGCYHTLLRLNPKVDIGAYRAPARPEEPMLVQMFRSPCKPGLSEHEQNRAGRAELLATPFATFEHEIRAQLARTLAGGGFEPARDILAITVNRWPHGYAHEYNPLFDVEALEQRPNVLGRVRFGRIAIANSDAGALAYTDSAIDQASRAVDELSAFA